MFFFGRDQLTAEKTPPFVPSLNRKSARATPNSHGDDITSLAIAVISENSFHIAGSRLDGHVTALESVPSSLLKYAQQKHTMSKPAPTTSDRNPSSGGAAGARRATVAADSDAPSPTSSEETEELDQKTLNLLSTNARQLREDLLRERTATTKGRYIRDFDSRPHLWKSRTSEGDKYSILPFPGEISYRCFKGCRK